MNPPWFRETADGLVIAIKLQPRASRNAIQGVHGSELKICVTAPPVDSAANEALVRFFAETLGCSRGNIQILRGQTSRHKAILVHGVAAGEIVRKLGKVESG